MNHRMVIVFSVWLLTGNVLRSAGPETEKRFPPLVLPEGLKATLFACDPLIEYPSVISIGPRQHTMFVAHDYMTGLGKEIVRRDEIRLLEDTDQDGYADKSTVYAGGFNSIQGLAYDRGVVYAMHAPYLTALRDTNGDGKADERKDLLKGLGLSPEEYDIRLHCANGVTPGFDGWLYLALGDHGCRVKRPEGDWLIHEGGAILRCRPDGTKLHVFASGLRNIYDVALDHELNVFVRDNENDGGTYKNRIYQSFHGADHGYPYLYYEHPDETCLPVADVGLGSSAGGTVYLEATLPKTFHGHLLFAQWGKAVMNYPLGRESSSFATHNEAEFATGGAGDKYPFKPTDVVVDYNGTVLISDWADGQRPKRGRGRIYRISPVDSPDEWSDGLNSISHHQRLAAQWEYERQSDGIRRLDGEWSGLNANARIHGVWIIARAMAEAAKSRLLNIARTEESVPVRIQAIRALADLNDISIAEDLSRLAPRDARLQVELLVALGRLRWANLPEWLAQSDIHHNSFTDHAIQQALRRCGNWHGVGLLLQGPGALRHIARRALSGQFDPGAVEALLKPAEADPESALALTRVHRRPGSWEYWGYRPEPRPIHTNDWSHTVKIAETLSRVLTRTKDVKTLMTEMSRHRIPFDPQALVVLLERQVDEDMINLIIRSLSDRSTLAELVVDRRYPSRSRLLALERLDCEEKELTEMLDAVTDGKVIAGLLEALHDTPSSSPATFRRYLRSTSAAARAAALAGLGRKRNSESVGRAMSALRDPSVEVQVVAAEMVGRFQVSGVGPRLAALANSEDLSLRQAAVAGLLANNYPGVGSAAAELLKYRETRGTGLAYLQRFGRATQVPAMLKAVWQDGSDSFAHQIVHVLGTMPENGPLSVQAAIAEIHGRSGLLSQWRIEDRPYDESFLYAKGSDCRWTLQPQKTPLQATTKVRVDAKANVQFLAQSDRQYELKLNGKRIHQHATPEAHRFNGQLQAGENILTVSLTNGVSEFQLKFRRRSSNAQHERLLSAALNRSGSWKRGKAIFFDEQLAQCGKCHRVGDRGGDIGPELTGAGRRFSPAYLVESILDPNRSVLAGYQSLTVELRDDTSISGVKRSETAEHLVLGDAQGNIHRIPKSQIVERNASTLSAMPTGLEQGLSQNQFVDLVSYLISLK